MNRISFTQSFGKIISSANTAALLKPPSTQTTQGLVVAGEIYHFAMLLYPEAKACVVLYCQVLFTYYVSLERGEGRYQYHCW